jgi:hypothetical protein
VYPLRLIPYLASFYHRYQLFHPIVLLVVVGVGIGMGVGIEIGIVACFEIIALLGGLCAKLLRIGFHTSGEG